MLHFVSFFHVSLLFSTGVDNEKLAVDNEKALELTNSAVFHKGRQWKSCRAGQQNIFFIFEPDYNVCRKISPKIVASCFIVAWSRQTFWFKLNFLVPKNFYKILFRIDSYLGKNILFLPVALQYDSSIERRIFKTF